MLVKNKNNELVELTYETKLRAIEAHLNIKLDGEKYAFDGKYLKINGYGYEYLILSDDEANFMQNERLDDYIYDHVLAEMQDEHKCYFDSDSFKRDCLTDGRGHAISDYDSKEIAVIVDNIDLFIYRTR